MGQSQLPSGMTREQAQHVYKVRTASRTRCDICHCIYHDHF
jgi:hypothetical protein